MISIIVVLFYTLESDLITLIIFKGGFYKDTNSQNVERLLETIFSSFWSH